MPYWTNVRFGRWEAILDEPRPPASNVFLTGAWHYARGTALAATGRLEAADAELAALEALMASPALDQPLFSPNSGRAIMAIGPAMLAGEIAAARGAFDTAIAHLDRAVRLEDALVYTEPAEWAYPTRHALGAVLLEAGRAGEAETVYWEDLRRNRENGWALTGLVQALRAQGKQADAEIVDVRRRAALARADVALPGSRFGRRIGGDDRRRADVRVRTVAGAGHHRLAGHARDRRDARIRRARAARRPAGDPAARRHRLVALVRAADAAPARRRPRAGGDAARPRRIEPARRLSLRRARRRRRRRSWTRWACRAR